MMNNPKKSRNTGQADQSCRAAMMVVNFMHRLDWTRGMPGYSSDIIWGLSVRLFLGESDI